MQRCFPRRIGPSLGNASPDAALAAIKDPLSQLVAAGVLFRSGRATPAVIATGGGHRIGARLAPAFAGLAGGAATARAGGR